MKTTRAVLDRGSRAGEELGHDTGRRPRPSMRGLRAIQPPPLSEGYLGLLYRTVSLPFSWLSIWAGLTANHVTGLWIVVGLICTVLLATGNYWWTLAGALGLQMVIVLDRADGDVARYTDNRTYYGKYLDLLGHALLKSLLFLGVGLGVYANRPELWVLVLGLLGTLGMTIGGHLRFYRAYLLVIRNIKFEKRPPAINLAHKMVRKLEHLWLTPGLFGMVLLGAVSNRILYVLIFYGITAPLWAASVSWRVCRELRLCDRDSSQNSYDKTGLNAFD